MSVALVALLVLAAPTPPTPPTPDQAWRDVPSLAHFMGADPVVIDGWLAFRAGETVVRLAPVPTLPTGATAATACGKLPRPEPDWAGIWAFPTANPVVLHLAEEATLWQWTPARRCWIEVPLRARGATAPGTLTRAARREADLTLALGPLDAALAGFSLSDAGGHVRLMRDGQTIAEAPVDAAARLLNETTPGETWTRKLATEELETAPDVSRTLTATLEVFADGARVLEVRREARWKTDGSRQGGAVTGKRLTLWRVDVTDPAHARVVMARNGSFSERRGDGAQDARYLVERHGVERVPGGELAVDVSHDEAIDAWDDAGREASHWKHAARFELRAGGAKVALWPEGAVAPPITDAGEATVALGDRALVVKAGRSLAIADGAAQARQVAVFRAGSGAVAGRAKGRVGWAVEAHRVVMAARAEEAGDEGVATGEVLVLVPRGRPGEATGGDGGNGVTRAFGAALPLVLTRTTRASPK